MNACGGAAAAKAVMLQMLRKGSGRSSQNPIRVSLAVGKAERNIAACRFKGDGKETIVNIKTPKSPLPPSGKDA
jgi:hypothetical protein